MCVSWSAVGLLLLISQAKWHPKAEKQIKPIHSTKILQGRVAPPLGDASIGGLPHIKFFFDFFCIVCVRCFFSNFFSDFYFIC